METSGLAYRLSKWIGQRKCGAGGGARQVDGLIGRVDFGGCAIATDIGRDMFSASVDETATYVRNCKPAKPGPPPDCELSVGYKACVRRPEQGSWLAGN